MGEFKKVVKDCRTKLTEADTEQLFRAFDAQSAGTLAYWDFLAAVKVRAGRSL